MKERQFHRVCSFVQSKFYPKNTFTPKSEELEFYPFFLDLENQTHVVYITSRVGNVLYPVERAPSSGLRAEKLLKHFPPRSRVVKPPPAGVFSKLAASKKPSGGLTFRKATF